MADFPNYKFFNGNVISSLTADSIGSAARNLGTAFSTATAWPAANLAFYIPFRVFNTLTIVKAYWLNGTTVGTDSVDIGIYGQDGTRLVSSGSVLSSGASAVQAADITDTTLTPGLYYMAMAVSGTTATFSKSTQVAGSNSAMGVYEQTSAFNLPSTATYANSARTYTPFIGLTINTTI